MAARPRVRWRPILALLALILFVGLVAVALAWRTTAQDQGIEPVAACTTDQLLAHVDLIPATGSPRPEQLTEAATVLRGRLSRYGCGNDASAEPGRLQVSLTQDALAHLDALLAPGQLQFREVLDALPAQRCPAVARSTPPGAELDACSQDGSEEYRLAPAAVVASDVKGAIASQEQGLGQWQVIITFTKAGQRRFTDLTGRLIGRRLAIVLDGRVISAPTIQSRIGGAAQVTGSFTADEATDVAAMIRYGPLPVPLRQASAR